MVTAVKFVGYLVIFVLAFAIVAHAAGTHPKSKRPITPRPAPGPTRVIPTRT